MFDAYMSDSGAGSAEQSIRDATKWLLASAASVLAVLTAGLPFSSIGNLAGSDFFFSVACVAVALGAALAIIFLAAGVLADTGMPLADLIARETKAQLRLAARKTPSDEPSPELAVLQSDQVLFRLRALEAELAVTPASPKRLQDALNAARNRPVDKRSDAIERATLDIQLYVREASRLQLLDAFRRFRCLLLLLGPLVPAAVITFLCITSAATANAETQKQAMGLPVAKPTAVTVFVSPDSAKRHFGAGCSAVRLSGTAVGGTWTAPLVVLPAQSGCSERQVIISSDIGLVSPSAP